MKMVNNEDSCDPVTVTFPSRRQLEQTLNCLAEKIGNKDFKMFAHKEVQQEHRDCLNEIQRQLHIIDGKAH